MGPKASNIRILGFLFLPSELLGFPIGPIVVPFWASYLESYKVIPKRNYYGTYGLLCRLLKRLRFSDCRVAFFFSSLGSALGWP